MLSDRVIPFFEQHGLKRMRMLTDGTEYCGNRENHEYELYRTVEDIDRSKIKAKSRQTNGICERFNSFSLHSLSRAISSSICSSSRCFFFISLSRFFSTLLRYTIVYLLTFDSILVPSMLFHIKGEKALDGKYQGDLGEDVVNLILHTVAETVDSDKIGLSITAQPDVMDVTQE